MYVVLTECASHYWMNIICRGWIQQRELHETECIAMDYSSKEQEITGENYLFIYLLFELTKRMFICFDDPFSLIRCKFLNHILWSLHHNGFISFMCMYINKQCITFSNAQNGFKKTDFSVNFLKKIPKNTPEIDLQFSNRIYLLHALTTRR